MELYLDTANVAEVERGPHLPAGRGNHQPEHYRRR